MKEMKVWREIDMFLMLRDGLRVVQELNGERAKLLILSLLNFVCLSTAIYLNRIWLVQMLFFLGLPICITPMLLNILVL